MRVSPTDLVRNILEAYVEIDSDFKVADMNENAESLLRRDRRSAVGQRLSEVIADAERSQHWPALVDLVKQGRNETIAVFFPSQYRWFDIKVIPLPDGGAALLMRDVTDRQWLIRREAERTYLRNVFEDAPVAITILRGRNLVVEYINAFGRQLVGGRRLVGLPIREALPDVEQREIFDLIENVFKTGEPFHGRDIQVRFDRNADGKLEDGFFDISYQAIRDFDGTISGVLGVSIDVTDRARTRRPD